jgi:hypothetical protein
VSSNTGEALRPVESAQNIFKRFLRVNPFHCHNRQRLEIYIGSDLKFIAIVCAVSPTRVASISPTAPGMQAPEKTSGLINAE